MPYVAVAVPFHVDNWYFDGVADDIERRLAERSVEAQRMVHPVSATASLALTDRFDEMFADAECIGAIAIGYEFATGDVRRLARHRRPLVTIGGSCPGISSVSIDDQAVARQATQHLIDLGHTAITHLGGYALSADDFAMRSDRVRGYSEAMAAAGIDHLSQVVPCDFEPGAARRVAKEILTSDERPTALFVVADAIAFQALGVAAELGLQVPKDLSVIAIDDHPDAASHGLTTFRQDLTGMARAAADLVLEGGEPRDVLFDVTLVERSTTAAPGRSAPDEPRRGGLRALFHRK